MTNILMKKIIITLTLMLTLIVAYTGSSSGFQSEIIVPMSDNMVSSPPLSIASAIGHEEDEIHWNNNQLCSCDDRTDTVIFDEVPQYYQEDYSAVRYGTNNVAMSGCGVTCVAMVASYLKDYAYTPDFLAKQYGLAGDNHIDRIELMLTALNLPVQEKVYNGYEVIDALKNGQVAIVLVNKQSVLTNSQHFIVCVGITSENLILIRDPSILNQEKFQYSGEFETGFSIKDIFYGFQGGWIFEKKT